MTILRKILVSFFGLGYIPGAPGTYGSFGAAVVFVLLVVLFGYDRLAGVWVVTLFLAAGACAVAVGLGRWATGWYGLTDPPVFVLDEVAGMWVALIAVPFTNAGSMFWVVLVQFLAFRAADIIKPTPARRSERLPQGWGILTDDIISGAYTNLAGQIIFRIIVPLLATGTR